MAIFKKRGRWWIDYRANGKRRREPTGSTSHALAKEILAKRQNEVAEQRHFPGRVANASTFGEVADKYWELHAQYLKQRNVRAMFMEIKTAFAERKIGTITPGDVQKYYNAILNRTSPATANRHLTHVKAIFNKTKLWGLFHGDSPAGMIRKNREPAHRLRYLSRDEMQSLLEKAHPRLYPVLMCALLTGMRRGEILGLTWENVSLERDMIYLLKTKSGKPRELPIPGKLREVLLSLGPKQAGPVFDLPFMSFRRYFDKALKDAKILDTSFHTLRHTFASHFIMRTNDLPALQNLLGHSSPMLTLRYAHLGKGHLASEMAAFESAIPNKTMSPKTQETAGTVVFETCS